MLRLSATAVFTLLLLPCSGAWGQVYKCVDGSGKTVYSQSPCQGGAKSATIRQAVPPAPPGAAASGAAAKSSGPKSTAEQEIEFRKRRSEEADAAKKAQDKAGEDQSKAENCRSAKTSLASLESGARQARTNENGERYFLEDGQIAQEKERARKAMESWCK